MSEGFKPPVDSGDNENNESIELTLEKKYKIVGKRDSILDKKGIHISINKLDELLAQGIIIEDKNNLEAVADAVLRKFEEMRREDGDFEEFSEVVLSERVVERKQTIKDYIRKYGFNDFSNDLMSEWVELSLKWVKIEGTVRASIIHSLRVMDLLRTGGRVEEAVKMARDAYRIAIKEKESDIVAGILEDFPQLEKEVSLDD